jgi:hypothetical protein
MPPNVFSNERCTQATREEGVLLVLGSYQCALLIVEHRQAHGAWKVILSKL